MTLTSVFDKLSAKYEYVKGNQLLKKNTEIVCLHITFFVCLLIFFTSLDTFAFQQSMGDNVEIMADKLEYDKSLDEIHATGNMKLTSGDTTLEADNVTYSQGKGHASVEGEFILSTEEDVITGKDLEYSFERSTGSMSGASVFIKKDNFHITGDELQMVGEKEYTIKGASFTTCDGDKPSWIVKASEIDVEIGEYLFADHARLYAHRSWLEVYY